MAVEVEPISVTRPTTIRVRGDSIRSLLVVEEAIIRNAQTRNVTMIEA